MIDTKKKKKTLGESALELFKNPDVLDHSPTEQSWEMLKDFDNQMYEAIEEGKKKFDGDFFVVYLIKKEFNINNAMHTYFVTRQTCPTPNYDQSVYKFHRNDEEIEYIWTLPDKKTYEMILNHAQEMDKEFESLIKFVFADDAGLLLQLCKSLNGEIY